MRPAPTAGVAGDTLVGLQAAQALVLAALRSTPRRYRLPPLPARSEDARAAGVECALAFAIEAARIAGERGGCAADAVRDLFVESLASFLREAMAPQGGDPAFQALVLQAHDAQVHEFVRLARHAPADRRALRSMTDALAHPGKTRQLPAGPARERLERLHALAEAGAWNGLHAALDEPRDAALRASPALQRLLRHEGLQDTDAVRRYLALCARRGPEAGSRAAAAQGRSAARAGHEAEHATVASLREVAVLLAARVPAEGPFRVLRSLRPPAGFPGAAGKAKDEWDAALVCDAGPAGAGIVLLAEVKASPAAASSDFSRLHRGLQRLAQARPDEAYAFVTDDGEARISGASLRALAPAERALPEHVVYCCTALAGTQPQLFAAASKAVLAAEPASLAYARQFAAGARPDHAMLLAVWEALLHAPRLRATLHQDATARLVREAMVHPADLLASLARLP
jgi:hypothetical protein